MQRLSNYSRRSKENVLSRRDNKFEISWNFRSPNSKNDNRAFKEWKNVLIEISQNSFLHRIMEKSSNNI